MEASLREHAEQMTTAQNEFQETWMDSLNKTGLVHDISPNETDSKVIAQHKAAVRYARDSLSPSLYKRFQGGK
jgi:hypothetical protein